MGIEMILNEIERAVICGKQKYRTNADFIDAIEAAVIAKLAQGVSVEPDFTACKARGYLGPGMMCGQVIVGDKSCGNRTSPCENKVPYHTADQLQTAIAAARVAENERCANWLDERGASAGGQDLDPYRLAIGIRALKGGAA